MSKIVRTKTRAEGGVTAQELERMRTHASLWIKRAMRTDPIEPNKIIPAIEGIYAAAGLKKPRVIIVPSPLVMAFAYGASAAIWYFRKNTKCDATHDATYDATDDATRDATYAATHDATYAATYAATYDATRDATDAATYAATYAATRAATDDATRAATYAVTRAATHDATYAATHAATDAATDDATYDATDDATRDATYAATYDATYAATHDATYAATYAATHAATYAATYDATYAATRAATHAATYASGACYELAGDFGLGCAKNWWRSYQGGNMWAGYGCYLTACRDILGLELTSHAAYAHWEQAAIHGGFRAMHEEFCLVSDFPEVLRVDEQNRPHCETGPSHRWRDGFAIYHWHGVRVPAHWIENRANLHPNEVIKAENVEQRAAGAAIIGWAKMLEVLPHKIIDSHEDPQCGDLLEVSLPGLPETELYLKFECPRNGQMMEAVNKRELAKFDLKHAHAWHANVPVRLYSQPHQRT